MARHVSKRILTAALALVMLSALGIALDRARSRAGKSEVEARSAHIPSTVLWAWERPTDLRFIDTRKVGVAFLARTVFLRGDEVISRPRLQPLQLPERASVTAVVRVESDSRQKPTLSAAQTGQLIEAVVHLANLPNIVAIQIDFDAAYSEREFYRNVIREVRRRLPQTNGLSITALASWCAHDDWISDLPVDEAVPMLFRMGTDRQQIRNQLGSQEEFSAVPCRGSYGISTDEPIANLAPAKRLYVFNPQPWTEESVRDVLESRR